MHLVPETILSQLGGSRFIAMTGAKNLVFAADLLQFDVRGANRISKVQVKLEANDTYTVHFFRWNRRALSLDPVAAVVGVTCELLRQVFTSHTGLLTSL
jgi:hypothetical protein